MTDFTSIGLPADLPEIAPPNLAITTDSPPEKFPLSSKQKAAVVVRALLSGGGHLTLTDLPPTLQSELATTLAGLRGIDSETELQTIAEFLKELEDGNRGPSGLQGALAMLDGSISRDVAQDLSKDAPRVPRGNPWPQLSGAAAEKIAGILETESPEIAAICLSKLDEKKAAEVLGHMSGPEARLAAFTVSRISQAKPAVIQTIGQSLVDQLSQEPATAFADTPAELLGSMLLAASTKTRDDIMEGLVQEDREFAAQVRDEIFIFADISTRIEETDIPKILRDIDPSSLLDALAYSENMGGKDQESSQFILSNMSKRLAEGLREDIEQVSSVSAEIGEAAQSAVVDAIRVLEADQSLKLKPRANPDDNT